MQVPLVDEQSYVGSDDDLSDVDVVNHDDPWEWWNKLRLLCGIDRKLSVGQYINSSIT